MGEQDIGCLYLTMTYQDCSEIFLKINKNGNKISQSWPSCPVWENLGLSSTMINNLNEFRLFLEMSLSPSQWDKHR